MKRICLLAILFVFLACKNSSSMLAVPPANIAGTYPTVMATNGNVAKFTNCTDALVPSEGNTVWDPSPSTCSTNDPFVITQSGNTWQKESRFFTCPTSTFVATARGTINGDRIDGITTTDSSNGIVATSTITNGSAGTDGTIVFRMTALSVSGVATGSCSIMPPLEVVYSQTRSGEFSAVGLLWEWKR